MSGTPHLATSASARYRKAAIKSNILGHVKMHSSIMALCKPSLPRDGDPYLGDTAPARLKPLRLERILAGKQLTQASRASRASNSLLSLPDTVWDIILEYLGEDRGTLANFALVSPKCNLLAKSVQFCTIHLTYSDNSLEMLTFLAESRLYQEEDEREGRRPAPTLGAFIREVIVRTDPAHIASRHKFGACVYTHPTNGLDAVELADRIQWGDDFYFSDYIGCISHVVEMGAVPHLFTFDWRDRVNMPETLVQSLLRSPAKELKLGGFVNLLVPKDPDDKFTTDIDLRSLTLHGIAGPEGGGQTGEHWLSHQHDNHHHLITLAAPSLETLCFEKTPNISCEHIFPDASSLPEFPRLRVLMLGAPLGKASTATLLGANLHTLVIDGVDIMSHREAGHLAGIGHMPTLRTFICRRKMEDGGIVTPTFLSHNPQLTKLVIRTSHLEEVLVVLADRLHNLTSLSLLATSPTFSSSAAAFTPRHGQLLSQLRSLEQLHLSVHPEGELMAYDQDLLRQSLRHLPNLRKLALAADTYKRVGHTPGFWLSNRYYNSTGSVSPQEFAVAQERPELDVEGIDYHTLPDRTIFELAHRNAMLSLAESHGEVMQKLEFVYIGQWAMLLTRAADGDGGVDRSDIHRNEGAGTGEDGSVEPKVLRKANLVATPLTESRQELLTYIHNTWGHHVETWGWHY